MRSVLPRIPGIAPGIALAVVSLSAVCIGQRSAFGGSTSSAQPAMEAASVLAEDLTQANVATPRRHCETPTPGPWPTSWAVPPDLVIRGMAVGAEPCTTCAKTGDYLGVVVEVGTDAGESPPFVVEVNGRWKAVGRLHRAGDVNVWFQGVPTGETVAEVDPDHSVDEWGPGDNNNKLRGFLPVPTKDPDFPTCTPAPSPTPVPEPASRCLLPFVGKL